LICDLLNLKSKEKQNTTKQNPKQNTTIQNPKTKQKQKVTVLLTFFSY